MLLAGDIGNKKKGDRGRANLVPLSAQTLHNALPLYPPSFYALLLYQ